MPETPPLLTHPETAWLLHAVVPLLTSLALLAAGLLARPRLALLVALARARRARTALAGLPAADRPDPALIWAPATIAPEALVTAALALAGAVALALSLVAPAPLALALGAPLTALAVWALGAAAAARYTAGLERELTAALGRLSALLRAGAGLRTALERVVADLPPGPLREEWSFLVTRQGVPLSGGGIATPQQVMAALADQTPSRRHAALLNHLGAAVGQPQEVLASRCEVAYGALQRSERRRDEAVTELAQMRYSGLAVGLAGVAMACYLAWSQWERVLLAYSTPLGLVVGPLVLLSLCLPVAGGALLARVADLDY
ncbi:MAG TPA: type II secretion system F family protein [Chloroflexaceae bacterium]|nr:type II secretion system F family protein [Chloroflexaceae bacterium]